jgi:hypothetical protein
MSEYEITRSAVVAADPARVHGLVDDFHEWPAWSPWEDLDPAMERTYTGPRSGVGAHYAWRGNRKAGAGTMEITASNPDEVRIRLEFLKPWTSTSATRFELAQVDSGTRVTWTMDGESDFMGKAFSLFTDLDKMIGTDFERGLANLKTVAESQARATAAAPSVAQ